MTLGVVAVVVAITVALALIVRVVEWLLDLAVKGAPRAGSAVPVRERRVLGEDWRERVPAGYAVKQRTGRNRARSI